MDKELAANFAGMKYDFAGEVDVWANRQRSTVLYVQKDGLSNASANEVKKVAGGRSAYLKNVAIPLPVPGPQELTFTSGLRVLWVGMRPSKADKYTTIASKVKKSKGASLGSSDATDTDTLLEWEPNALRVVVPFEGTAVTYYALINPNQGGICKGISIPNTEVFFFPEWRKDNESTSLEKRKQHTGDLVRTAVGVKAKVRSTIVSQSSAQITSSKNRNNEVVALVSTYLAGGDPSLLRHVLQLLHDESSHEERNEHLVRFFEGEGVVDTKEAASVKADIEGTWPELRTLEITAAELEEVSMALRTTTIAVHPSHRRAFLVGITRKLRSGHISDKPLLDALQNVYDDVKLQLGTHNCAALQLGAHQASALSALLYSVRDEVDAIRETNVRSVQALKDHAGAQVTTDAFTTVMDRLAVVPDVDAARLNVASLFRLITQAIAGIGDAHDQRLKDLAEQLSLLAQAVGDDGNGEVSGEARTEE